LKLGAPRDRTATESKIVAGTGANGETVLGIFTTPESRKVGVDVAVEVDCVGNVGPGVVGRVEEHADDRGILPRESEVCPVEIATERCVGSWNPVCGSVGEASGVDDAINESLMGECETVVGDVAGNLNSNNSSKGPSDASSCLD
jgi:hypothetical protein